MAEIDEHRPGRSLADKVAYFLPATDIQVLRYALDGELEGTPGQGNVPRKLPKGLLVEG